MKLEPIKVLIFNSNSDENLMIKQYLSNYYQLIIIPYGTKQLDYMPISWIENKE